MKSIAVNLMSSIRDLCVWGNYKISNDGILELCMAHPESRLRRVNHCGCYKVSDDSRLWFMSSFKTCVINYIRVEEFGIDIDYKSVVEISVHDPRHPSQTETEDDQDENEIRGA